MKKLLIAGGSHADIPLIQAAKRLGYHVTTSGNRSQDLGHAHSDAFEPCDYSDPQAVLALARKIGAEALCACCNDFSALSCAFAAKELGLPGHDDPKTAEIIHHKDQWRAFAHEHDIPSPQAIGCSNMEEVKAAIPKLRLPLIVKPVDLTGGKGILRADTAEDTLKAAEAAFAISKAKRIVVEEFITGTRHGFTCILRDGRVAFHFADDEMYHLSPYLVSAACTPTSCPQSSIESLIEHSERIAGLLDLVDGIFHVQFIQHEDGKPVIIEICRRAPGDLYIELVRHATGAPYAEWIVRAAAGLDLSDVFYTPSARCVTRHCLMADHTGTFEGFDFDETVASRIMNRLIWAKEGDKVTDPLTHKFGIVFVQHRNEAHMREEAPQLQKLLRARLSAS
ncbi:MAG: ATP-grasp domain-containing protein [Verrucomicrobiaceae bacterium]|nr:ATP-grasp domain-containing protein [Verrucomicrobiaceae bacterium]